MTERRFLRHRSTERAVVGLVMMWVAALLLKPVAASTADVRIDQVLAGANGDSRVQFLVLVQEAVGQNQWGPSPGRTTPQTQLKFYDAAGRETGVFGFPANPGTGGSLRVLVATSAFAALAGMPTPDVIIPPLLHAPGGMVCFETHPDSSLPVRRDCVSYGAFRGSAGQNVSSQGTTDIGAPAPALAVTGTRSLRRHSATGTNADFQVSSSPEPVNLEGARATLAAESLVAQGGRLFMGETFEGNGRTCATCHAPDNAFGLTPSSVARQFATVDLTADPLFVAERAPSLFDAGADYDLNTVTLVAPVAMSQVCSGLLQGRLTGSAGGSAHVVSRLSDTQYLVAGGLSPRLAGTVSDGTCQAEVSDIAAGTLGRSGTLPGLEDPRRMRTSRSPAFPDGRALFLENVDGLDRPAVFRKSPTLLNLRFTAPFGFSGDVPNLRTFSANAVLQHFPRTLARQQGGAAPDLRLPTEEEAAALEAFMLAQEFPRGNDPGKFDLDRYVVTAAQRRGRDAFFGNQAKCSRCHGGPVLAQTTVSVQGKPVGVNAAFNTGVVAQAINGPGVDAMVCEPADPALGTCGSREFSTPQLFNVANLGPYFHDNSAATLRDAVDFYDSAAFNNSPAGRAIGGINLPAGVRRDITAFLESLVVAAPAPTLTRQPEPVSLVAGGVAVFQADTDSLTPPTWQWQRSVDRGTTWTALSDGAAVAGASTDTLVLSDVAAASHGHQVRAVATTPGGIVTSRSAELTVYGPVSVSPASVLIQAGDVVSLAVTASGASSPWSASSSADWLRVSVLSDGSGVRVEALAGTPGSSEGQVTIQPQRAGLPTVTVRVVVETAQTDAAPPFGQVDTPAQGAAGVSGALAVTGWALDDTGVAQVRIYRNCVAWDEPANCQVVVGQPMVFVTDAVFVDGARPDVAAVYPATPQSTRAGWGALVLTNLLPDVTRGLSSGGEGPLVLHVIATDRTGKQTMLGRTSRDQVSTTVTLANRGAVRPFGTIDAPAAGAVVTGTLSNFGWALTADTDVTAGDAGDISITDTARPVTVFIDGEPRGIVSFGHCRGTAASPLPSSTYCDDDVASTFGWEVPQAVYTPRGANPTRYRNLDAGRGAIGAWVMDTRTLADGWHTIAWSVVDSAGRTEGIGSRVFRTQNGVAARPATHAREDAAATGVVPRGRTGFDLAAPWLDLQQEADGSAVVRVAVGDRLELLMPGVHDGAQLDRDGAVVPLPVGSSVRAGRFFWVPPPGVLGEFSLVFWSSGGAAMRVRVTVEAAVGIAAVQAAIDTPVAAGAAAQPLVVAGWALDEAALSGSGVGAVHVWAQPVAGGAPVFLGEAALGGARPDVATAYGVAGRTAGFSLSVTTPLPAGEYEISAYIWLWRTGRWEDARRVRVWVR